MPYRPGFFNSYYDPPDYPCVATINSRKARAAADYTCHNCSQPINRGTLYIREAMVNKEQQLLRNKDPLPLPRLLGEGSR